MTHTFIFFPASLKWLEYRMKVNKPTEKMKWNYQSLEGNIACFKQRASSKTSLKAIIYIEVQNETKA